MKAMNSGDGMLISASRIALMDPCQSSLYCACRMRGKKPCVREKVRAYVVMSVASTAAA